MPTKLWYLMDMDIFKGLRDDEYAIIDRDSAFKTIKRKEIMNLFGTTNKYIYFLKKGIIKIMRPATDGRALTLDILKPGTLFGELGWVLDDHEDDEIAEALEDSLLCVMRRENFDKLIAIVPSLSRKVTKIIGLRRRKIENRLRDLLYSTVAERLAKTLLRLSEEFGVQDGSKILLNIRLTHNDLSELIASTRETVTATLNTFREKGIIDYKDKYVCILDIDRLRGEREHPPFNPGF